MKVKLFRFDYGLQGGYKENYLGAGYSNKKPTLGEDWIRGGDLSDGKFNLRTLLKIARDILRCEISGSKYRKGE